MGRFVIGLVVLLAVGVVLAFFVFDPFDDETRIAEDIRDEEIPAELKGRERLIKENTAGSVARSAHIRGVVVDAAGRPLPRVPIAAIVVPKGPKHYDWVRNQVETALAVPRPEGAVVANATTDAEGRFMLDRLINHRSYAVVASPPRPLGVTRTIAVASFEAQIVRLVAREGARLNGRVVDANGKGVVAWLTGFHQTDNRMPVVTGNWQLSRTATAADGTFQIHDAPAGELKLTVVVPGVLRISDIPVRSPSDEEVVIRIAGTGSVTGVIRDMVGEPVAGARVAVTTTDAPLQSWTRAMMRQATTDGAGRYRVENMFAGRVQGIAVVADGYIPWGQNGINVPMPGGSAAGIDATLVKGGTIRGRVLDEDGAGVAAARVIWVSDPGSGHHHVQSQRAEATSSDDGSFVLNEVSPGRGYLHALCADHFQPLPELGGRFGRRLESSVPVELEPEGATVTRDIVVRAGTPLRGTVSDDAGRAVPEALVEAVVTTMPYVGLMADPHVVQTDADGVFVLPALFPGVDWTVTARQGGRRSASTGFRLTPSGENVLHLVLYRTSALAGRVETTDGEPIANANVTLRPEGGRSVWAISDTSGAFRFDGLAAGTYGLFQSGAYGNMNPRQKQETVELGWGELRDDFVLTTDAALRLAGVVVDPAGEPVPNVNIVLQNLDRSVIGFWTGRTNFDGRFEIVGLTEGRKSLRIGNGTEPVGTYDPGATNLRIVYEAPKRVTVTGQILDQSGTPIGSANVTVYAEHNNSRQGFGGQVANGRFAIEVPDKGTLRLEIRDPRDAAGRPLNLRPVTALEIDRSGAVEVRLETGTTVSGRVTSANGTGVSGLAVSARATPASGERWYERVVTTTEDGAFTFPGLDDSDVELQVHAAGEWTAPPKQTVKAGATDVLFVVQRGAAIEGRVTDEGGNGLRATVSARLTRAAREALREKQVPRTNWNTQCEPDGRFRLPGLPSDVTVSLSVSFQPRSGAGYVTETLPEVATGATDVGVTLVKGVYIEGRVLDTEGNPTWNVSIEAKGVDGVTGTFSTWVHQAPGEFRLGPLRAGRYTVTVRPMRSSRAGEPQRVLVDAPTDDLVLRAPKTFKLTGVVTGKNVSGFSVTFMKPGASRGTGVDGTGHFEMELGDDEPGTLFAQSAADDRYALVEAVRPSEGPFKLVLKTGLAIEGRIEGFPSGGRGSVSARTGSARADGTVSKDGSFRIPGLPPGDYQIRASVRGGNVAEPPAAVAAGSTGVLLQYEKRE